MPHLPVDAHSLQGDQVAAALACPLDQGLSHQEAEQRRQTWGPNTFGEGGGTPAWRRFLGQFHDPLLYTLLAVGAIKVLLHEAGEALVIWSVTLINAGIGYVQESRAETAIAALARSVRTEVEVIREGQRQRLASEQLVPGDLVCLEAGNKIPADLRLLEARNLQVDESSLTGESLPAAKGTAAVELDAALAERVGMAYAGSSSGIAPTARATAPSNISAASRPRSRPTRKVRPASTSTSFSKVWLKPRNFLVRGVLRFTCCCRELEICPTSVAAAVATTRPRPCPLVTKLPA